ncbi:SDR family NAD(P)-dependent oxidoreductase [Arhodomonas aquaeolei]|uniref:SDR family NAD(P)-dependent oxidoreductase n=1 Tax=Arhodomonas aquaeolei TaxID=2369 RepID=UPI000368285C|nr:SDR family NAD(P)-dependent oxidoreductase [Arhodomonas aquaeolei]
MTRTILITGASSGFGEATARRFAAEGWRVVATARRRERLARLTEELGGPEHVHAVELDMRDREAVMERLGALPAPFDEPDVLVNNAGIGRGLEPAWESDVDEWEAMVDTNVKGLMYATRAVLPGMVERNRGHVVDLGSIAGRWPYPGGNVYGATKAFVAQFSGNLRADLLGTRVRVTNLEPGLCETEFSIQRFRGDAERAASLYRGNDPIVADDLAEIIHWVVHLPPHVNINSMEIMPVSQSWGALPVKPVR